MLFALSIPRDYLPTIVDTAVPGRLPPIVLDIILLFGRNLPGDRYLLIPNPGIELLGLSTLSTLSPILTKELVDK